MSYDSNKKKDNILVWVTNPSACQTIVQAADRIAKEKDLDLVVINIQKNFTSETREYISSNLIALSEAVNSVNAELTVVYSDNNIEAAFKIISNTKPAAMVTGLPGTNKKESFIDQIYNFAGNVPIYCVDNSGNVLRMDS